MNHRVKTSDEQQALFWEQIAAQTRWGRYLSTREQAALVKAVHLAGKPAQALEVGCEGGRWSKMLADTGWTLICTDITAASLAICQARIPQAVCLLVHPEETHLPCKDDGVTLLLCIEVNPVISSAWFLKEATRVLQKDGLLVGVFWNKHSWKGLLLHQLAHWRGTYDWYRLSYTSWKRQMQQEGFTFVYEEGLAWLPFRRTSNAFFITPALWIERLLGLRKIPWVSPWVIFICKRQGSV